MRVKKKIKKQIMSGGGCDSINSCQSCVDPTLANATCVYVPATQTCTQFANISQVFWTTVSQCICNDPEQNYLGINFIRYCKPTDYVVLVCCMVVTLLSALLARAFVVLTRRE